MIEQIMTLENLKRLLKMAKTIRGSKECGWQEKYLILEGEIMKLEEHLTKEFLIAEAEYEKEQRKVLH
jgi:hypothetical protein|tara:strand:+ start:281 stop:484 length:204 start_codon:yes stop_codon:yes gene_type:complete